MKIGKTYKRPSKNAKRFFDGMESESTDFSFLCGACQQAITLDLWQFLDSARGWEKKLTSGDIEEIKSKVKFPRIKDFTKSHEGGKPYLAIKACTHCSHRHLVYVGFYEFQPARYFGTLQGVYEVIT